MKPATQNGNSRPRKAGGAKELNFIERLVDYGTDDEETVEEPTPLRPVSSSVEVPRGQKATIEDAREIQTTTTVNGSVAKIEPPSDNVCALQYSLPTVL